MATKKICNYAVVQTTLPGIDDLGYKPLIVWAALCAAFIPVTYLFYPGAANRSLEDIDRFFASGPGVIVRRNKVATQLSRPQIYYEEDEKFAQAAEKDDRQRSLEKGDGSVMVEKIAI